jgi:hypothetical protein
VVQRIAGFLHVSRTTPAYRQQSTGNPRAAVPTGNPDQALTESLLQRLSNGFTSPVSQLPGQLVGFRIFDADCHIEFYLFFYTYTLFEMEMTGKLKCSGWDQVWKILS